MHNVMEVDNMDEPVKKKYNIVFAVLLLIMLSAVYIWLSSVYFLDYINRSDIIKVHFSQFFILFVPLFLYFSFAGTLVFLNKEMVLKNINFSKFYFLFFFLWRFFLLLF